MSPGECVGRRGRSGTRLPHRGRFLRRSRIPYWATAPIRQSRFYLRSSSPSFGVSGSESGVGSFGDGRCVLTSPIGPIMEM